MQVVGVSVTRGTVDTVPSPTDQPTLSVADLTVEYPTASGPLRAVAGISFDVAPGETLGLVGESGCGKSSTGRAVMQMPRPSGGTVRFEGMELTQLRGEEMRRIRPRMQMIFQDPISCLNPRRTVRQLVEEPMAVWEIGSKAERRERADALLDEVGVDPLQMSKRHPWELSGGQCQRVSIARAIALDPTLLICDEPVSALDVSVQAQVLNLLEQIRSNRKLTMLFIAHDLAVVKNVSDRICVMYLGKVCEIAPSETIYSSPKHHYSAALIRSVPIPDPTAELTTTSLAGEVPSPLQPPSGCRFRTRCPAASERCVAEEPELREVGIGQFVACHHPL
jgi:peptide/nickel transport system ATP-binding protein